MKFEPYKSVRARGNHKINQNDKVIYNYWKDLEEFEKMEENKTHKIRDVFFGSTVNNNSVTLKKSVFPGSIFRQEPDKKRSVMMNRLTLHNIRHRNTVLKNVNQIKDDSQGGQEENFLFKRVTGLLELHLQNEQNCFRNLMNLFQDYIIKKYEVFLKNLKKELGKDKTLSKEPSAPMFGTPQSNANAKKYGEICNKLCREINHFVQVLVKSLILFYNFDISKFKIYFEKENVTKYVSCDILNFENLMNFITILMFPKRLNILVLKFLSIKNKERNDKFLFNQTNKRKYITMKSLGISQKFRLNEDIVEEGLTTEEKIKNERKYSYYFEHDDEEYDVEKRPSIAQSEYDTSQFKKLTIEHMIERKNSLLQNLKKFNYSKERSKSKISNESYSEAIQTLSYLRVVESPFEKMKVLLLVVRKLIKAINEYFGPRQSKQEVMTGEQLMSLITYVVSRAECPELSTHLEFVRLFLPKKLSSTFCGYYLTVFEAATEYMINYRKNRKASLALDSEYHSEEEAPDLSQNGLVTENELDNMFLNNDRRSKPGSIGIYTDYGKDQNGRVYDLVSPLIIKKVGNSQDKDDFRRQFTQADDETPSLGDSLNNSAQSMGSDKPRKSKQSKKSPKKQNQKIASFGELDEPLLHNLDSQDEEMQTPKHKGSENIEQFEEDDLQALDDDDHFGGELQDESLLSNNLNSMDNKGLDA